MRKTKTNFQKKLELVLYMNNVIYLKNNRDLEPLLGAIFI